MNERLHIVAADDDPDCLHARRERPTPVVVVSAYYDLELQEHARHECVMA